MILIPSLVLLLSASSGAWGVLKGPAQWLQGAQEHIDQRLNHQLREEIIERRLADAPIHGRSGVVRRAFQQSLQEPSAIAIPGVAEFFAAELLLEGGHYTSSAEVMELAWQRFDYQTAQPQAQDEFVKLSRSILWALEVSRSPHLEADRLRTTMEAKLQAARDQK